MAEPDADREGSARKIGAWQVRTIILIVGTIFLLIAIDLTAVADRPALYTGIVKDIGVVILGLLAVDFVWQLVGGDPIQNGLAQLRRKLDGSVAEALRLPAFADHARRLGMEGIFSRQDKHPLRIPQRIGQCVGFVDISGWALTMILEDEIVQQALVVAAKRGVKVRILLAHPDSDWLKATNSPGTLATVQTAGRELLPMLRELAAAGASIRRVKDVALMASILRFDDWMQVMPYLVSAPSANTPRFHLRGPEGTLFKSWLAEFDCAFNRGQLALVGYDH